MKISKLILCVIPLLFCCTSKDNTSPKEADFMINTNTSKLETFNISHDTSFNKLIPLETTKNSLIKKIEKVYFNDSTIIIFDASQSQIFLFDIDGGFKTKCGKKGNAPGEHVFFSDVYCDRHSKRIFAYEGQNRSMYVYDLSGELLKTVSTPNIWFRSFCKVQDGYWLYTGMVNDGYENSVLKVDDNFNIIKGYIPQKSFFQTYWRSTFFQDENGENFFISPYGNIIYHIEGDNLKPYFEINFDKNRVPYDRIPNMTDEAEYNESAIGDHFYGNLHNFVLYKDHLYFNFSTTGNNSKLYLTYFNKESETSIVYDSFSEYQGVEFPYQNITFIQPVALYEDNYICVVEPHQLSQETLDEINRTNKTDLNEESNPVLFFLKVI